VSDSLASIADFIRFTYSRFNQEPVYFGHGTDNSWDEAISLVLQGLDLPWDFANELWSCRLTRSECSKLLKMIDARIVDRIPLPYLTHQAWFCEHRFYVDERVLIPRSPIAELILDRFSPWLTNENLLNDADANILDLCTGSGCIGIACALEFESAKVDLLDISAPALAVADMNIINYSLQDRVQTLESDGFSALGSQQEKRYDLIVSNPPYVDAADFKDMPEEFSKEPELGLVSGKDGLDFVRQLLSEAARYLKDDGLLVVEVGNSWEALEQAYPELPFTWIEFEFGGHGVFVMQASELALLSARH
jgi:ribosomal protein L3 glutamine methyltransferase